MKGTLTFDGKEYPIKDVKLTWCTPHEPSWVKQAFVSKLQSYQAAFLTGKWWIKPRKSKGYRRHVRRMKAKGRM